MAFRSGEAVSNLRAPANGKAVETHKDNGEECDRDEMDEMDGTLGGHLVGLEVVEMVWRQGGGGGGG
jgi:hypothetical protein